MRSRFVVGVLVTVAGACLDAPTLGDVSVELTTPHTDDGAILFLVHAAAPTEIRGATGTCAGCQAFIHSVSATEAHIVVTGPLVAGPIARLEIGNAAPISAFRVEIREVARRDYTTRSTSGYRVDLVR